MTGTSLWIVAALLAQGAIAFLLMWRLGAIRIPLVTRGKIHIGEIALSREPWPEAEKRVSNAFDNQFQLPVLFYVACGISLYFGPIWLETVLAWVFVLSRIAHAVVFAVDNNVIRRFSAYTTGFVVLAILWIDLAVRLLLIVFGAR